MLRIFLAAIAVCSLDARLVTIHNDQPRFDVNGDYVDAHDGMILEHDGTYFLYGESYGNQTLATSYPWKEWPRLSVYTSTDLMKWTYRGPGLTHEQVGGTLWVPNVMWHEPSQRFILWFGQGDWGTATSTDGITFTPVKLHHSSRFAGTSDRSTDGTGLFVDDDGTGYVIFASFAHQSPGHVVSIERLEPDLLTSTGVNVTDFFPDNYVESPSLFKRKGWYYVTYGSCCCGCSQGGGVVMFKSKSVVGPWHRQMHADINCRDASAPVCGGYGLRHQQLDDLVFNAQWWGASLIPVSTETTKDTGGNDGTAYCSAYCASNWNNEMPSHWQGACCVEAFDKNTGELVSCTELNSGYVRCRCARDDSRPFLPNPVNLDTGYVCGTPTTTTTTTWETKDTSANDGRAYCSSYCANNWNNEMPTDWQGACCLEAFDSSGNRMPCTQTNYPGGLTCRCGRDDSHPFLSNKDDYDGTHVCNRASPETAIMFTGRRWLSGPNLPAGCKDICSNGGKRELCLNGGEKFLMKSDYSVWYPLQFNEATGDVLQMQPLSSFQFDLPEMFRDTEIAV